MSDAGVGDNYIERAEAFFSIRDDGVCLRRVGDVEVSEVSTATLAADFVGDGVAFCLEQVGDDDMTMPIPPPVINTTGFVISTSKRDIARLKTQTSA
jgi:hypothetical protein